MYINVLLLIGLAAVVGIFAIAVAGLVLYAVMHKGKLSGVEAKSKAD